MILGAGSICESASNCPYCPLKGVLIRVVAVSARAGQEVGMRHRDDAAGNAVELRPGVRAAMTRARVGVIDPGPFSCGIGVTKRRHYDFSGHRTGERELQGEGRTGTRALDSRAGLGDVIGTDSRIR